MKHCHCGLREHFQSLRAKRLGAFGVVLMVLHILFHVVECLLIPALLVAFHHDEATSATVPDSDPQSASVLELEYSPLEKTDFFENWQSYLFAP